MLEVRDGVCLSMHIYMNVHVQRPSITGSSKAAKLTSLFLLKHMLRECDMYPF